jgi:hypothetical protein
VLLEREKREDVMPARGNLYAAFGKFVAVVAESTVGDENAPSFPVRVSYQKALGNRESARLLARS